jgi:hypothetical protein
MKQSDHKCANIMSESERNGTEKNDLNTDVNFSVHVGEIFQQPHHRRLLSRISSPKSVMEPQPKKHRDEKEQNAKKSKVTASYYCTRRVSV